MIAVVAFPQVYCPVTIQNESGSIVDTYANPRVRFVEGMQEGCMHGVTINNKSCLPAVDICSTQLKQSNCTSRSPAVLQSNDPGN